MSPGSDLGPVLPGRDVRRQDDAPGERRRRSLEEMEERARTLNGDLTVDQPEGGGTTVRVVLPPYVTTR